jgi:hypothetical protein
MLINLKSQGKNSFVAGYEAFLATFETENLDRYSTQISFLKVCIFNLKTLLYLMEKESVF